jgi:rhodanese-related sulfurtransferase
MSQNSKHQESPVDARAPDPLPERTIPPSGNADRSTAAGLSRHVALQLLAILGLGCVLGFTFNAASPLGVRFAAPTPPAAGQDVVESPAVPGTPVTAEPVETAAAPVPPPPPIPTSADAPSAVASPHSQAATNLAVASMTKPSANPNPSPIHWPEAKALAAEGRAVLMDVRHKSMFDAGHIPGAISLPEHSPPQEFTAFLARQPTNVVLVVYCSSTSCSQSARVANRLVNEFHWPSVRYMTGGYREYQEAELTRPAPSPTP